MKLKVEKGELILPEGFSFEIEQNSAFFSENGAASVAATIPATPADLEKLGHPTRIARRERFVNLFPAILSHGAFQKKGTLVVNSVSDDGITCAIALEDSDFYSKHKDTNLKELFAAKVKTDYSTPAAWYAWLFGVYDGSVASDEFRVIPVAVNYSDGEYQVNNEPIYPGEGAGIWELQHDVRIVKEGDAEVSVPEGYGMAPFYLLYRFFEDLFSLCGYTVGENCFRAKDRLNRLLLLHNCSDVICKGRIDCSDLVPNKSVSEILEWMLHRFHAQVIVHPTDATVDIVLLEDILSAGCDLDLSDKLLAKLTTTFSKSSRIVFTPDTSLEGAAPAADTIQALVKKYGSVKPLDEAGWRSYKDQGLVLRLSTGQYYEIYASFTSAVARNSTRTVSGGSSRSSTPRSGSGTSNGPATRPSRKVTLGSDSWHGIGSNYFRYDRDNAEGTEERTPADLMAPMVFVGNVLMPYVGSRTHRNTSYDGSLKDEDQEIIIAEYAGLAVAATGTPGGHYYYGTTQPYDNTGAIRDGGHGLDTESWFPDFFRIYNRILLNNRVEVEGRFDLSIPQLMDFQMYALKHLDGQRCLPTYLQYEVGRKIRCLNARFLVVKDYTDGIDDDPVAVPEPAFKWQLNETEVAAAKAAGQSQYPSYSVVVVYDDDYSSGEADLFIPAPTAAGQRSVIIQRTVKVGYMARTGRESYEFQELYSTTANVWFDSVAV